MCHCQSLVHASVPASAMSGWTFTKGKDVKKTPAGLRILLIEGICSMQAVYLQLIDDLS